MKHNQLAIIPAREGSKELKDKNIRLLNNKPLITYTIESAINSRLFDKIVVTTDSNQILKICRAYNEIETIRRVSYLCEDNIPLLPVIKNAITIIEARTGIDYKIIFTLQPTSPLRTAADIIKAYAIYKRKRVDSLISVKEIRHSLWRVKDNKVISLFKVTANRQLIEPYYMGNGAIFIANKSKMLFTNSRLPNKKAVYVMDTPSSIDIHNEDDLRIAEYYLNRPLTDIETRTYLK